MRCLGLACAHFACMVEVRIVVDIALVDGAPRFTSRRPTPRRTLRDTNSLRVVRLLGYRAVGLEVASLVSVVASDIAHIAFSKYHCSTMASNPAQLVSFSGNVVEVEVAHGFLDLLEGVRRVMIYMSNFTWSESHVSP